jgi:hypothetical protein
MLAALVGLKVDSKSPRAAKARLDDIRSGAGKRKGGTSGPKRDNGGAASKRQKKAGEGSSSMRAAVKRQSSSNCTLNRNCALLDGTLPLSVLAEPCGVCLFLFIFSCFM